MTQFLDAIADCVNPLIAILAITLAGLEWRADRRRARLFVIATMLGVGSIYIVMYIDRALDLRQRFGGDYSTHTAFATTLIVSMLFLRPRWRLELMGLWLVYMVLILYIGYHTLVDVIIAAVIGAIVTIPWHVLVRRRVPA